MTISALVSRMITKIVFFLNMDKNHHDHHDSNDHLDNFYMGFRARNVCIFDKCPPQSKQKPTSRPSGWRNVRKDPTVLITSPAGWAETNPSTSFGYGKKRIITSQRSISDFGHDKWRINLVIVSPHFQWPTMVYEAVSKWRGLSWGEQSMAL